MSPGNRKRGLAAHRSKADREPRLTGRSLLASFWMPALGQRGSGAGCVCVNLSLVILTP